MDASSIGTTGGFAHIADARCVQERAQAHTCLNMSLARRARVAAAHQSERIGAEPRADFVAGLRRLIRFRAI